jgi:hypothetical protein
MKKHGKKKAVASLDLMLKVIELATAAAVLIAEVIRLLVS